MRSIAIFLAILLAGCAGALPVPETVKVPVPVSCVEKPAPRPDLPSDDEFKAADSYHAMLSLWLDRRIRQIYEARLEAALAGCWQPAAGGM